MKHTDKAIILVTIICAGGCSAFCFLFVVPRHETQERVLSPRVTLIEKHRVGPPIVGSDKTLEEQTLLFEGRPVWSTRFCSALCVSPNEKFVAIEHWLHSEPIVVLNLRTGRRTPIQAPEEINEYSHYYVYPFTLKGWTEDSSAVIVEVTGTYVQTEPTRELMSYRESWHVDVETGRATKQGREVEPWKSPERPR